MDDLIQVSQRIYLINSPTNGKFPMAFSFLVMGTDTHALIDTGCGEAACRTVMEKYGVDIVINSHCHPDHVSGNCLFDGKELWIPQERSEETGAIKRLAERLVGPDASIMADWEHFVRQGLGMRDYRHTKTFRDNDRLDFGGIALQMIHTPGHLDDHYCFLEPEANVLLTFDVDLTTFGPFYGNPEADISLFRYSLGTGVASMFGCIPMLVQFTTSLAFISFKSSNGANSQLNSLASFSALLTVRL